MTLVKGVLTGQQQRRQCLPEFKRDAVQLVRSSGRTIADVAREPRLRWTSLNGWITKDRRPGRWRTRRRQAEVAESKIGELLDNAPTGWPAR